MTADGGSCLPHGCDVASVALARQRPAQGRGAVARSRRRWWWRRGGAGGDCMELFFGYGRPCDHAAASSSSALSWRCPRVSSSTEFLLAVVLQRRVPTVQTVQQTVAILQVPLLDWFLTCPLLCIDWCHRFYGCQGRRHLCRGAEAISHGPDGSADHRISEVALRHDVRCPCYAGPQSKFIDKVLTVPVEYLLYGGDGGGEGFFAVKRGIFRALTLSAIFRSPRWRTVLLPSRATLPIRSSDEWTYTA